MKRFWLLLLLLTALLTVLLGACRRNVAPVAPVVGTLELTVTGLPEGTAAAVSVTGPNGFTQSLTQSDSLVRLAPGAYSVSATPVTRAAETYTAAVSGSPATVAAGAATQVSVAYSVGSGAGGTISGTVRIVGAGASTDAPFVPGEVIVKFKPGLGEQALRAQALAGVLEPVRALPLKDVGLYRASPSLRVQSADLKAATLALVAQLSARDDVLYATPNYLLSATAEPNDPLYAQQWHLRAINLPAAWDQTTGSADVTVAIIDSGVVTTHPDLEGKLLPGYDFVNSSDSGDGDGRDGDPTDPKGISHGTHVAGTVGAATNNGLGVAGVSWGARILPVRVLGTDDNGDASGTLADAIDGILWSVGERVPGVPSNPNPADVLNLSLGGPFLCSDAEALQDAFDQANAAGAVVVVAAGNDNDDASDFTPASCGNVIAVGATTIENKRADYSNYGPRVAIMAPGGDTSTDLNNDGEPDGVLSTVRPSAAGNDGYAYFNGTSMASPHVAGVAALLKGVRPSLSTADVRDILTATAAPLTDSSCKPGCGGGLVDAAAALATLATPVEPDFSLALSPAAVSLSAAAPTTVTVLVSRSGNLAGAVAFSISGLPGGLSASFAPSSTTGDSVELTLTAAADLSGKYTLQVQGVSGGVSKTVPLSVSVAGQEPPEPTVDIAGAYVFACPVSNTKCTVNKLPFTQIETGGLSADYTIPNVPAGNYHVFGWNDLNGNGQVDNGEPFGSFPTSGTPQTINPPVSGVNLTLVPALGTQARDLNKFLGR